MSKAKGKIDPHDPRLNNQEARRIRRKRERENINDLIKRSSLGDKSPPTDAELDVAMKLIKEIELPEKIRTFGLTLRRRKEHERPFYSGGNMHCSVNLGQSEDGTWLAVAMFSSVNVVPGLTSSSIKAALRNLRGHLGNLAIALDSMGVKPR